MLPPDESSGGLSIGDVDEQPDSEYGVAGAIALDVMADESILCSDDDGNVLSASSLPTSAEQLGSHARRPTQIARSRNWLSSALDDDLRAEEVTLGRELDDAIGNVRQWREVQALRFEEMRKEALASMPPPTAEVASRASPTSRVPASVSRQLRHVDGVDENAFAQQPPLEVRCNGLAASSTNTSSIDEHSQAECDRLARIERRLEAATLSTVPLPESRATDEDEDLLQADAAMEQLSSDLMDYSTNLQAVLSKLHALERS